MERALRSMAVWLVLMYVQAWLLAPVMNKAAENDIELYSSLETYILQHPHRNLRATSQKFSRHLQYLSEDLVGLFDEFLPLAHCNGSEVFISFHFFILMAFFSPLEGRI